MTATVQHWKNPTVTCVIEPAGNQNYRVLATFGPTDVTEAEALENAQLFADAYNATDALSELKLAADHISSLLTNHLDDQGRVILYAADQAALSARLWDMRKAIHTT